MSFADTFTSTVAQAWNQAGSRANINPDARLRPDAPDPARMQRSAHERKLASISAALTIASNPNPMVALADIITLVTLQRMVLEDPATEKLFGPEAAANLVSVHREQEAKAWRIGERAFTPGQQQELVDLIAEWRREHPEQRYVSGVRLEDFARDRERGIPTTKGSGSLLSLIMLDPFAALDPASREMEKSRMLGERVFFYATRMPAILKWQIESLYLDLSNSPEMQKLVNASADVSAAAQRVSAALTDERDGLIADPAVHPRRRPRDGPGHQRPGHDPHRHDRGRRPLRGAGHAARRRAPRRRSQLARGVPRHRGPDLRHRRPAQRPRPARGRPAQQARHGHPRERAGRCGGTVQRRHPRHRRLRLRSPARSRGRCPVCRRRGHGALPVVVEARRRR
jgi:hypothetical protein